MSGGVSKYTSNRYKPYDNPFYRIITYLPSPPGPPGRVYKYFGDFEMQGSRVWDLRGWRTSCALLDFNL